MDNNLNTLVEEFELAYEDNKNNLLNKEDTLDLIIQTRSVELLNSVEIYSTLILQNYNFVSWRDGWGYVYKITNLINGKKYLGSRNRSPIDDGYMGSGILIRKAVRKYGKDNFSKEILYVGYRYRDVEEYLIRKYEMPNDKNWYNISWSTKNAALRGEDHPRYGTTLSDEHKKIISFANKGKMVSEETRQKISETHKDKPKSLDHKRKISNTLTGKFGEENSPCFGKKASLETKEKISRALTGKKHSEEHKRKNGESHRGGVRSDETKKKMSESQKGKPKSLEHRRKMSEANKNAAKIACPHCGKLAGPRNIKRWHFDNCKHKI